MKRSCRAVPQRTRSCSVGRAPEARTSARSSRPCSQRHLRVRRHLEAAELDQAQAARGAVGRIQLVDAELGAVGVAGHVDQQVAQQPVDQPGRRRVPCPGAGSCCRAISSSYRLSSRASSTRGAWEVGPDEQPREQVGQRRVILPVGSRLQAGPGRRRNGLSAGRPADHHVVAAAGAAMRPSSMNFSVPSRASGPPRTGLGVVHQARASLRGVDVDLDHARIGGDRETLQPWIVRCRVALEHDRLGQLGRGRLDRPDQVEPVSDVGDRRQEDVQVAVARLECHRGAHEPGPVVLGIGQALF
jgi:hypothetical protein